MVKPFAERDIAPALALAKASKGNQVTESFPEMETINNALNIQLTTQEHAVLKLIWGGNTNNQIADLLFISVNTVKTHVLRLYKKLEVSSRVQAVTKAMSVLS